MGFDGSPTANATPPTILDLIRDLFSRLDLEPPPPDPRETKYARHTPRLPSRRGRRFGPANEESTGPPRYGNDETTYLREDPLST